MVRNLPWGPAHDTAKDDESPARKRVKREPLSDPPDSPPLAEVKREDLEPAKRDLSDDPSVEESDRKNFLKYERSPDSSDLSRHINPRGHASDMRTANDDMMRPTDGRTVMPKGLHLQKHGEAVAARQQALLNSIDSKDEKTHSDGDASDEIEFAGTHLHNLITTKKSVWSLTGLYGAKIKSSTRAAAGFGPSTPLTLNRGRTVVPQLPHLQQRTTNLESSGDVTESSDEDDLDGPAYRNSTSIRATGSQMPEANTGEASQPQVTAGARQTLQIDSTRTVREERKRSSVQQSQRPSLAFKSRMQSFFDDLDDLPEPPRSSTSSIPDKKNGQASVSKTPERSPAEINLESNKSRSHNVPTFLL